MVLKDVVIVPGNNFTAKNKYPNVPYRDPNFVADKEGLIDRQSIENKNDFCLY